MWSFLLASGYLKVEGYKAYDTESGDWKKEYELALTNFEVKVMFRNMIRRWFGRYDVMLEPRETAMKQGAYAVIIEFKVNITIIWEISQEVLAEKVYVSRQAVSQS